MIENSLFQSLFDVIPFGVYVSDVKTDKLVYMNVYMRERVGWDHAIGSPCWRTIYRQERKCSFCRIGKLLDAESRPNNRTEIFEHFNDANDHWYQLQEKTISWPDGRIVKYSIAVDITQLKETQNRLAEAHAELALKTRELERLAMTDALTGLYNRLKLQGALELELERFRRYHKAFSLLMLDLDHFKSINDLHGHGAGDEMLRTVAATLLGNLRKIDLVGRWGGEEFIVICTSTAEHEAAKVARKLRDAIHEIDHPGAGVVSASFGVAECLPSDDIETLLHRVDKRLYLAKAKGRNRVVASDLEEAP